MRRLIVLVLSSCLLLLMAGPALAHPTASLMPTMPTDVTFAATDNIDYLGRFPEHAGTAGGMRLGDRYYLTDPRGVYVYDVAGDRAAAPELLGSLSLYQTTTGAALAQEDPNTDGTILLVDGASTPFAASSDLTIVDVSDPANLSVLSTVDTSDHTWTCATGKDDTGVLRGCAYAFGRSGEIIDLTDPTAPTILPRSWRSQVSYGDMSNSPYTHDLTEIRPGLVMSAGSTAILMDTSALLTGEGQPGTVREIARIEQLGRFPSLGYHSVEWAVGADGTLDPYVVLGTEIAPSGATNLAGSDCQSDNSVLETWDARQVVAAIEAIETGQATFAEATAGIGFTKVDAFQKAGRGAYVDGNAPAHVLYCAHWMELEPGFEGGGMVATSYYDRGTRFVEILPDGTFAEESGWIVPFQGYSGSVQWVTEDVLYIHDYTRGLEVIRFNGQDATGTYTTATSPLALSSNFTTAAPLHVEDAGPAAMLLLGMAMAWARMRRRTRTVG